MRFQPTNLKIMESSPLIPTSVHGSSGGLPLKSESIATTPHQPINTKRIFCRPESVLSLCNILPERQGEHFEAHQILPTKQNAKNCRTQISKHLSGELRSHFPQRKW